MTFLIKSVSSLRSFVLILYLMQLKEALLSYLNRNNITSIDLKTILFDMDGVLYDSMPYHVQSWYKTMKEIEIACTQDEFYLYEGKTGRHTIDMMFVREKGRHATDEEKKTVYHRKTEHFNSFGKAPIMPGVAEVLSRTKGEGLIPVVVTGSGQSSLIDKLQSNFPDVFTLENMVTAFDVEHGKPHPEPYFKGLAKTSSLNYQAIVVENAPLGVEAASAAKIFTIAVNTGPLDEKVLYDAGADKVYPSMQSLADDFMNLLATIRNTHI